MGLLSSSKEFNSLEDLLIEQLSDLYDAEHRIADGLSKMIEEASNQELKEAFRVHHGETQNQIDRLDRCFKHLGIKAEREECEATKGLIEEAEETLKAKGSSDVKDAAIIAAAQRIEHYEIAGYGTARNLARRCGFKEIAELCSATLEEEKSADSKLTTLATRTINPRAEHASNGSHSVGASL